MTKELREQLTCSRCGEVQELHCQIVYSQGSKVCLECKKETLESDKRAFDRDVTSFRN